MPEPVPAVETVPPAAPEQAVVTPPAAPAPDPRDVEIAKLKEERDNYKTGMLNAKDKLKKSGIEEEPEKIDVVAVVDQRIEEKVAPLKAEIAKITLERDELARAASARAAATPGGATGSQQPPEEDLPKLTPAEEALLARRGLSAKDVLKK